MVDVNHSTMGSDSKRGSESALPLRRAVWLRRFDHSCTLRSGGPRGLVPLAEPWGFLCARCWFEGKLLVYNDGLCIYSHNNHIRSDDSPQIWPKDTAYSYLPVTIFISGSSTSRPHRSQGIASLVHPRTGPLLVFGTENLVQICHWRCAYRRLYIAFGKSTNFKGRWVLITHSKHCKINIISVITDFEDILPLKKVKNLLLILNWLL